MYDYRKRRQPARRQFRPKESFDSRMVKFWMGVVDGAADLAAGVYAPGGGGDSVDAVVAQSVMGSATSQTRAPYAQTMGYKAFGVWLRALNSKAFLQYCRTRLGTADPASIGVAIANGGMAAQAAVAGADLLAPDSDAEDAADEDDDGLF